MVLSIRDLLPYSAALLLFIGGCRTRVEDFNVGSGGSSAFVGRPALPDGDRLAAVWGSSKDDVYIVTADPAGLILHSRAGGDWQVEFVATAPLHSVSGSGANDVYVVGENGTILHSNGDGLWRLQPLPSPVKLFAVYVQSADAVYVGGQTFVVRPEDDWPVWLRSGGTWRPEPVPSGNAHYALAGGSGETFAVGLCANHLYAGMERSNPWRTMGEVFAQGSNGAINWSVWVDPSGPVLVAGVDGGGNGYVLLGPREIVLTDDSAYLRRQLTWPSIDVGHVPALRWVWGSSLGDVWACGDNGTLLHGGISGFNVVSPGINNELHGIWGSGPDDVYVVGWGRTVLHYGPP